MTDLTQKTFLWGVAHSSFQVEGSPKDSDWRRWTQASGRVKDGTTAELGTNFWNEWRRDLDWVSELGANSFRFSLAWERLEPRSGEFDTAAFARYREILLACRERGIEPLVTFLHFTLPGWLVDEGGLTSARFAECFERYCAQIFAELGDLLKYVITINEPMVQVTFGYLNGIWPPGLQNQGAKAARAAKHLALAHARVYTLLKAQNPHLQISVAHHWRLFDPRHTWNPLDRMIVKIADGFFNQSFLSALLDRRASFAALGSAAEHFEFPGEGPLIDFLGVNYYGRMLAGVGLRPPFLDVAENPAASKKSDLGWEIYPEGLLRILKAWKLRAPRIPIFITENGVADSHDRVRSQFVADHILSVFAAASELSVEVIGYTHWSLTDNFEWSEGLEPRFGLIAVDYPQSGRPEDLAFAKRPAFFAYQRFIRESRQ